MSENTLTVYTGWRKWHPTTEEWVDFYMSKKLPFEMLENEYLIIYLDDGTTNYYCYEHGEFRQFRGSAIKTVVENEAYDELDENGKKKKTPKYAKGKSSVILPRNDEQVCAIDLLKDASKTIKLISGSWGMGKTLLLVTAGLEALREGKFEQIVWIRNSVRVKDTPDLGALPGDSNDKLLPFLGPMIDHAGESSVRAMIGKETLKVEPLQFIRGRNFANTLIICTEAENLTKEHLQLIIARAAEGSEIWIDGDCRQRDAVVFEKSQGLESMINIFKGKPLFGYVNLIKSERSATAAMADLLD